MSKLSRLSDLNIEDDIYRGIFYGRIMAHISDPTSQLIMATVRPIEEYRPDLMAYRLYGTADLRWVISLVCGVADEAEPLPVGDSYFFPDSLWIRQSMRHFLDEMGLA